MGQEPKRRQEYIKNVWRPYPEAASDTAELGYRTPHGTFKTRGRISAITENGFELQSNGTKQNFVCSDNLELEPGFNFYDVLKAADIVDVSGTTRGNEFRIDDVSLLVPSLASSPFESSGFGVSEATQWQEFQKVIREYFVSEKFLELRTPTLVPSPGMEPFLDPFETQFHFGSVKEKFYLPTSPEFHLKKALARGFEKCFEFKECFRNGELSEHHEPEFLMLEWYRAYDGISSLMDDCREILRRLQDHFETKDLLEADMTTMEALWKEMLNFDLRPQTTAEELKALAQKLGISFLDGEDFDDLFTRLFVEKVEPALAKREEPVIVWHFPPSQAALARLTPEGWADRFEFYWRGFEIANAFHELNDPFEQRRRFDEDQKKKAALGKPVVTPDEEFLKALEYGMPPSAGIALGVERLFMALFRIREIKDARLFTSFRPRRD